MRVVLVLLLTLLLWEGHLNIDEKTVFSPPPREEIVFVTAYTIGDGYTPDVITASGKKPYLGSCAYNGVEFGTKILYNNVIYIVEDRTLHDGVFDVYLPTVEDCIIFGAGEKKIFILED